jgi:molecular chaperone DnaK (HSP70)
VEVRIPLLKNRKGGDENLACSITQAEFEIECEPLLSRIRAMVGEALSFEDARSRRMSTSLIQGSRKRDDTWMGRLLGAIKGGSTSRHSKSAGLSSNERLSIWLLGNASRMPAISRELRGSWQVKPASLAGVKSPVALGAARLGGMRSGVERQLLLLDVTSRSLGTSTAKDPFIPLIERNTTFTTVADNQPSIEVPILEQSPRPGGGCRIIDVLRLDGIPPCAAGTPKIEVSFDVDGNGILDVSAKNLTTGNLVNVRYDKLQSTPSTINQYHRLVQEWLAKRRERR